MIEQPEVVAKRERERNPLLIVIAVLLALILVAQIFTIVDTQQQRAAARERARLLVTASQAQINIATELMEDYEEAAYDNPSLERITEQQLIAAEFQITAMQLIGLQNHIIIGLLALPYEVDGEVVNGE